MTPTPSRETDAFQETDEISISELFHENSKQQRYDLEFSRRIGVVNSSPGIHRIISRAFKTYPGAIIVSLPEVQPDKGLSLEQVIAERRSVRRFTGEPLDLIQIAKLLYFGNGIMGRLAPSSHGISQPVRAAPSGGALYPIELYTVISRSAGLDAGIYHYAVAHHTLEQLAVGHFVSVLAEATSDSTVFSQASMVIILTIMPGRSRFKYGERGYRFALLEAGHIAQNILLTATALGLGAVAVGGFIDDEINEMLDIDGVDEASIYLIALGHPAPVSKDQGLMNEQSPVDVLLEMLWASDSSLKTPDETL